MSVESTTLSGRDLDSAVHLALGLPAVHDLKDLWPKLEPMDADYYCSICNVGFTRYQLDSGNYAVCDKRILPFSTDENNRKVILAEVERRWLTREFISSLEVLAGCNEPAKRHRWSLVSAPVAELCRAFLEVVNP